MASTDLKKKELEKAALTAYIKKSFVKRTVAAASGLAAAALVGYLGSKKPEK